MLSRQDGEQCQFYFILTKYIEALLFDRLKVIPSVGPAADHGQRVGAAVRRAARGEDFHRQPSRVASALATLIDLVEIRRVNLAAGIDRTDLKCNRRRAGAGGRLIIETAVARATSVTAARFDPAQPNK
jgi:hypothetical protein